MKGVLVIEDHPLVADVMVQLLSRADGVEAVTAGTAAQALQLIDDAQERWFRIFLDLMVPGAFGLSLAKQLVARDLASTCCVISASDRDDYVQQLRAWGFMAYIAKSTPVETFTARLSDVMNGVGSFPSTLRQKRASEIRLTMRQTEVLEGIQRGLSSKQIAGRMGITEGTVNNQVAALMQLIHADSRSHAVAKAISLGLLDPSNVQSPAA